MSRDLDPTDVAARLSELRARFRAETIDEARDRLEAAPTPEAFVDAVSRRLAELRALCDLTRHLHRRD